jgi:acetoin utilization deacetylase AcuC-like enzyme
MRALAASSGGSGSSGTAPPPVPVVYHPLYSAPRLAPGHQFPMQVFERIYARLLRTGMILPEQVHTPQALPTDAQLSAVHCPEYLAAFSGCRLDAARVRRCAGRGRTALSAYCW